jgi:hypothetical protein
MVGNVAWSRYSIIPMAVHLFSVLLGGTESIKTVRLFFFLGSRLRENGVSCNSVVGTKSRLFLLLVVV